MFTLELSDRENNILKIGDIVKISNGGRFSFYSEVKYLHEEKAIAPFSTFSFHSFVKSELPDNAVRMKEERYNCWYIENPENDEQCEQYNNYLIKWRAIEDLIEKNYFKINFVS